MPESRAQLLTRIVGMVGSESLTLIDRRKGWPGLLAAQLNGQEARFAVHVAPVGRSHRKRDDVERRFQNPGQNRPIIAPEGYLPVVMGLWEEVEGRPVIVAMDPTHRIGDMTRKSLFSPLSLLRKAAETGWAEQHNSDGELLRAFHPTLLPPYLDLVRFDLPLKAHEMETVVEASGFADTLELTEAERVRRTTSRLVRDAAFRREVRQAYGGLCAMCGFNFSLVTGAHIYPASAPGAPDHVSNGLALCYNHHAAFDAHLIFVHPETRAIGVHEAVHSEADRNSACRTFVDQTFPTLAEPGNASHRPAADMFLRRYAHFSGQYDWAA